MTRIADKPLAELCNRWSVSESSGIDTRRCWQREANAAPPKHRQPFEQILEAVARGDTLGDAVTATGQFFPPLFVALVAVGETTGKLPDVLSRLAAHYENRVKLRREFISSITWPVFQLVVAVLIVGLMIWLLGFVGQAAGGKTVDGLGLGLIGNRGVAIYAATIAGLVACGYGLFRLLRSDLAWSRGLQRAVLRVPVIGKAIETLAVSRFAWSLGLGLEAGMEIKTAVNLAFDATQLAKFRQHQEQVVAQVAAGNDLTTALAATQVFSGDFIGSVEVGEHSGALAESLLRQSDLYQEKARTYLSTASKMAGFLVWGLVATIIVVLIFRIFTQAYLAPMNDMLNRMR